MTASSASLERGSIWRQWDFHIHTPASFQWSGRRFAEMTEPEVAASVDQMIHALNEAEPAVFVLMDYWTFDGWFALRKRLLQDGAPVLNKLVLPGIELRLVSPTNYRLNAHVIFSDDVTDQDLSNFKSDLRVALIEQPLSNECLQRLVRQKLGADLLAKNGFKIDEIRTNDVTALLAGSKCAEIVADSYKAAISKVPDGKAIAFMPWDTYNGLAKADWATHYSYVIALMQSSPIFETRKQDQWAAFVGVKTAENEAWFDAFQTALGNRPHLAVSGSDAHSFNDYAKFPGGKATWIKADPSFRGLLQAIMEPAKRSFIGDCPAKLAEVTSNKTFFIDKIAITKSSSASTVETWLDGTALSLNPDLVAIIGKKGSGKSALADVIALLGNSRQKKHFSFLKVDRFRGKSGEPAKHFVGTLTWCDSEQTDRNLNEDSSENSAELVRYIPQGHFENLCNDHVSGQPNAFEKELRAVIFSHAGKAIQLGALDFDQLIEQQEGSLRDQLNEFRKDLRRLNLEIAGFEDQLRPEVTLSLRELLVLKQRQIEEHRKIMPVALPVPSTALTDAQISASATLADVVGKVKTLDEVAITHANGELLLAGKLKAIQSVRERMRLLERSYKQFHDDTAHDLAVLGLKISDVAVLELKSLPLDQLSQTIPVERDSLKTAVSVVQQERANLLAQQTALSANLNAPQLLYQQNLTAIETWRGKLNELVGVPDAPETLSGLEARILQLEGLPALHKERHDQRLKLAGEIFDILDAQRKARELLFQPVQDLIEENTLIRDEYKLQFQATLGGSSDSVADSLFSLIKQNSGDFRGEDESYRTVRNIAQQYDFNKRSDILAFISALHDKLVSAAAGGDGKSWSGIASILRKDKAASDVYDLLFGLSFLEPRYSLLFQDTQIEQLSPGQRGALLLIFYLLVDKGRNPIILDQPEENLDNETVYSLLVPVLCEAKKKRQIIMVTHNPNLAVVCDAEQIIHSSFDRKDGSKITYVAGSIENPLINSHVINVLEGTKPAFNNRRIKYH